MNEEEQIYRLLFVAIKKSHPFKGD